MFRVVCECVYVCVWGDIVHGRAFVIRSAVRVYENMFWPLLSHVHTQTALTHCAVRVVATDQDQVAVSAVFYEVVTQHVPFVIDRTSGVVTTSEDLDRETVSSYVDSFSFFLYYSIYYV